LFLQDYHEEHAVQAFKRADHKGQGFISALNFHEIMTSVKSHLLTPCVKDNLVAVAGGQQVSFPFFVAFNSMLGNMELAKKVFLNATGNDKTAEISKGCLLAARAVI
jgi:solute carrier family 25 aspartate/glutamate transporter 12/13